MHPRAHPSLDWLRANALITLTLATLLAGAVQSLLKISVPHIGAMSLIDDAFLALTVLALLTRIRTVPRLAWIALGVWILLVAIAAIRSSVGLGLTLEMARQITVPALLIVIGLALTQKEWLRVAWWGLIIAAANAVYAVWEIHVGRIFHPGAMASASDRKPHGIPASYFYWDSAGVEHVRAGGLVLNAPVAGIVIAAGIVLAWWLLRGPWRFIVPALMIYPLYLTHSRAGMVIVAAGLLLPVIFRVLGTRIGSVLLIAVVGLAAVRFASHGNSLSHVQGFTRAMAELPQGWFGQGFGTAGNFIKRSSGGETGSESLVGIVVSAMGLPGLLIIAALITVLVIRLFTSRGDAVLLGMFLGLLAAAVVSESVSALNGTIPLWIAGGVALLSTAPAKPFTHWPNRALIRHPVAALRASMARTDD